MGYFLEHFRDKNAQIEEIWQNLLVYFLKMKEALMGDGQFSTIDSYETFLKQTRIKINGMLNKVLWICIIAGPALALGIWAGIFPRVQYSTSFSITALLTLVAICHKFLVSKFAESRITSYFALIALDVVLFYMASCHVNIALTYFLVPLVALLFCDKKLYLLTCALNFVVMLTSVWNISEYYAQTTITNETPLEWYLNLIGGYVIESSILVAVGYLVCKHMVVYFSNFYKNQAQLLEKEEKITEQFAILSSMTEIYQSVNLLDLEAKTSTFFGQHCKDLEILDWSKRTRTKLNEELSRQVMLDQYENFLHFTNLSTLVDRIGQKKVISDEFISVIHGWFRAQYIVVNRNAEGVPNKVIYTIQNIDEDKKREEHLIRISNTDEMTHLFNRRSYENDVHHYKNAADINPNLVLVSADTNGLKQVNDTLGHEAGDEIIMATANCLVSVFGNIGKIYRIGGDEFMVVAYTATDFEKVKDRFLEQVRAWSGNRVDRLAVSIGYVCKKDFPDANIEELEKIVDSRMYAMKHEFYKDKAHDRRVKRNAIS
jgi:diguanylate cyclase (GGDEF)-like protein